MPRTCPNIRPHKSRDTLFIFAFDNMSLTIVKRENDNWRTKQLHEHGWPSNALEFAGHNTPIINLAIVMQHLSRPHVGKWRTAIWQMPMSNLNSKIDNGDGQQSVPTQLLNCRPTCNALAQRPLATVSVVLTNSKHSRGIDPKPGLFGAGYVELALGSHTGQSATGMRLCAGLLASFATRNTFLLSSSSLAVVVVERCPGNSQHLKRCHTRCHPWLCNPWVA